MNDLNMPLSCFRTKTSGLDVLFNFISLQDALSHEIREAIEREEEKAAKRKPKKAAKRQPIDPAARAAERRPGRVVDRMLDRELQARRAWPSGDKYVF